MELTDLCRRYRDVPVPVVCDALYTLGLEEQILPSRLRPLLPETRIVGEAYTVLGRAIGPVSWDEGIPLIEPYLRVFEDLTPDSILVSVNPESTVGHFGELTANAAQARGCQGVILEGNVRDTEGLRSIGFQVFYSDLSPTNAIGRWEMEAAQVTVSIDGVAVNPGDIVIADFDGIVIVPRVQSERVLLEAESIDSAEASVRAEAAEGVPPMASFEVHGHI